MNDECLICYDLKSEMVFLQCSHKLCDDCYENLQKNSCPFCRAEFVRPDDGINEKLENSIVDIGLPRQRRYVPPVTFPVYDHRMNIRVRRRRRRRDISSETIHTEHGYFSIEVAQSTRRKRKRPNPGKNNRKKGRWAQSSSHVRCSRVVSVR